MKSFDYESVVIDGEVFCTECAPAGTSADDVMPIFADSEWPYPGATCSECGGTHDYMNITGKELTVTDLKTRALMQLLDITDPEEIDVPTDDTEAFGGNGEEYLVLTDEEADTAAKQSIEATLWAFNADFLSRYTTALNERHALKAWSDMMSKLCEAGNPIVRGLLGDNFDRCVSDAITEDGRAHFLNTYDGREEEVKVTDSNGASHTFYLYRVN